MLSVERDVPTIVKFILGGDALRNFIVSSSSWVGMP